MLDEAELRLMSPEQRARIARTLAALDAPRPFDDPKARKRRKLALTLAIGCCIFLAAWIGVLAVTLPSRYSAGGWRGPGSVSTSRCSWRSPRSRGRRGAASSC